MIWGATLPAAGLDFAGGDGSVVKAASISEFQKRDDNFLDDLHNF
jgi:hypothetical protein